MDGSLRNWAIAYFGFRNDVLWSDAPIYPGQRVVMFLSYSFVHVGPAHFAVNMVTLVLFGRSIIRSTRESYALALFGAGAISGAATYALIGPGNPVIGASGALFGLLGALIGWELAAARLGRTGYAGPFGLILIIVILNAVQWWLADGILAWQVHLGGGISGLLIGLVRPPKEPD